MRHRTLLTIAVVTTLLLAGCTGWGVTNNSTATPNGETTGEPAGDPAGEATGDPIGPDASFSEAVLYGSSSSVPEQYTLQYYGSNSSVLNVSAATNTTETRLVNNNYSSDEAVLIQSTVLRFQTHADADSAIETIHTQYNTSTDITYHNTTSLGPHYRIQYTTNEGYQSTLIISTYRNTVYGVGITGSTDTQFAVDLFETQLVAINELS